MSNYQMDSIRQSGKRRYKTPTAKNAERERSRVRSLRNAFQTLQSCLPSVPPDTKLSKLDILILATNYIAQLMQTLKDNNELNQMLTRLDSSTSIRLARTDHLQKYYHPIKVCCDFFNYDDDYDDD